MKKRPERFLLTTPTTAGGRCPGSRALTTKRSRSTVLAGDRETLAVHQTDPRPVLYDFETLESAQTRDPIWNAAQRQLVRDGCIHGYLRMVWGKKILEWSSVPPSALHRMIEVNNKYGLDGCDPNSYSGIFWVLGRYDRPMGPERPIYGKVRYMSSRSAIRKLRMSKYLLRYGRQSADSIRTSSRAPEQREADGLQTGP